MKKRKKRDYYFDEDDKRGEDTATIVSKNRK